MLYINFQGEYANSTSVCPEDFFPDPVSSGECKPQCSSWIMYSRPLELVTYVAIGSTTVIGILTTAVIIVLSFVHFKNVYVQTCIKLYYYDL